MFRKKSKNPRLPFALVVIAGIAFGMVSLVYLMIPSSKNNSEGKVVPDPRRNSDPEDHFRVRAWIDIEKTHPAQIQELMLPSQSKQIDIYRTVRTWASKGTIHSQNITIFFLWRSSTCVDNNRDQPQGLMRTLSASAKPYDVVIDIGACYGDTAVPLATRSNIVLAFEPNPHSFTVLKANADINTAVNIIPYNLAVGQDEFLEFFYGGDYCNGGRWGQWKVGDPGERPVKVRSISLPSFLDLHHPGLISRIGLVKIDTEGYDGSILSTLRPIIDAAAPAIIVEWFALYRDPANPDTCTVGSRDLFRAIDAVGYTPFDESRPHEKVLGCESRHWVPDLLLLPKLLPSH